MRIVFTGGGTGGHIYPVIAIIREVQAAMKKRGGVLSDGKPLDIHFIGPKNQMGTRVLRQAGVKVGTVLSGKLRRYLDPVAIAMNLFDFFVKIPLGIIMAFFKLFFLAPDLVFSKGGFGSLPIVIAAWILQIPIFVHESDSVTGFTNRLGAKFAREIFLSFPNKHNLPEGKVLVVGNPVRPELATGDIESAKKIFHLTGEKPVVMIVGGSQGATRVNDLVVNILPEWLEHFELIHITGRRDYQRIRKEEEVVLKAELKKYYHPVPFLVEKHLKHAYRAAQFIVSRAGGALIFEIAALGKPSVMIPLPESAQDHQLKNAYAYAESGGAVVVEHANLTPHFLLEKVRYFFSRPDEFRQMAHAARAFAKPRAARIVAAYIITFLES